MYTASVDIYGNAPIYHQVPAPPAPSPDQTQLQVLASGLHNVVRARAAGQHFSSGPLSHVPGIDGVGQDASGKRFYFSTFAPGAGGSMSEVINVASRGLTPLPEGADIVQTAALVNPAMSSWMAIKDRSAGIPKTFKVLILGATSASGKLAIHLARALGAEKVVGAARNGEALAALELDDRIIISSDDASKTDFSPACDVDLVLDYVSGAAALAMVLALGGKRPVQYVHIGALSGDGEINIPGSILRSKDITVRGSGPGAWSMISAGKSMPELLEALKRVPKQPVKEVQLKDVEAAWSYATTERIVFVPGETH